MWLPRQTVTNTDLHFGFDPSDPNGVLDCDTCAGQGVVSVDDATLPRGVTVCPACRTRQELRDWWWRSSEGPAGLDAKIRQIIDE